MVSALAPGQAVQVQTLAEDIVQCPKWERHFILTMDASDTT